MSVEAKDYLIPKPKSYRGKWNVFNSSTFSSLDTIDCNDTVEGICYTDKTFDECTQTCEKSSKQPCNYGYYIENDDRSICVVSRIKSMDINPNYRLRNKRIYPELDLYKSTVFIDKTKYPYPPNDIIVKLDDRNILQNVETGKKLSLTLTNDTEFPVKFTKTGRTSIQILPLIPSALKSEKYTAVKYSKRYLLNIPESSLIMNKNQDKNDMVWKPKLISSISTQQNTLGSVSFVPIDKSYQNSFVNYSDNFYIFFEETNILGLDERGNLVSLYMSKEDALDQGYKITFTFLPQMKLYYCDREGSCRRVPRDSLIESGRTGKYKGVSVSHNPACWGNCKKLNVERNIKNVSGSLDLFVWIGVGVVIVTIIIVIVLAIKF